MGLGGKGSRGMASAYSFIGWVLSREDHGHLVPYHHLDLTLWHPGILLLLLGLHFLVHPV